MLSRAVACRKHRRERSPSSGFPIRCHTLPQQRESALDVRELAAVTGGSGGNNWTDAEERRDDKIMRERKHSPRSIGAM
jgi:hypothetical protein